MNAERFYVYIERRYENTYWGGRYTWELWEGGEDWDRAIHVEGICTSGNAWTRAGARHLARRAQRKVVHSRTHERAREAL